VGTLARKSDIGHAHGIIQKPKARPIPLSVYRASALAQYVAEGAGIGTNRGLYVNFMTLMGGHFRESRGCMFPALIRMGYGPRESRRVWRAAAVGAWDCNDLLARFHAYVGAENFWVPLRVAGCRVMSLDTVGFFRPRLKGLVSRHFAPAEHKTTPAICMGQLAAMGRVGEQPVALPLLIVRGDSNTDTEDKLMGELIGQAGALTKEDWVACADRKFKSIEMVQGGLTRIVKRVQKNAIFRREAPPDYPGVGRRSKRGERVRPLARRLKGKVIDASPPDEQMSWQVEEKGKKITVTASIWRRLRLYEQRRWSEETRALSNKTVWTVYAFAHPGFEEPMLVITNAEFTAPEAYQIVRGRWGVEQPPLVSKQILGLHRQNVWSADMRYRLPELGFIAAAILTYIAASSRAIPVGWWDTHAKPTAGRLRWQLSVLRRKDLRKLLSGTKLRVKKSATAHLPAGNRYPRRPATSNPLRN